MKLNKKTIIIGILILFVIYLYFQWKKYKAAFMADQIAKGASPDSDSTNPTVIDFLTNPITGDLGTTNTTVAPIIDPITNQVDKKGILDTWLDQYNVSIPPDVYNYLLTQPKNLLEQYASYTPSEFVVYITYLQGINQSNVFLDNVRSTLVDQGH